MIYIILFFILVLFYFNNKGIPAVLYHQINEYSNVDETLLEEHLKYLNDNNYKTITLSEYLGKKYSKKDKLVMLTFDDGYYDNYRNMFPLLKKYNMKATIFLNTFFIKDKNRTEDKVLESREANKSAMLNYVENKEASTFQYMTWNEIREMYQSGLVDFQGHSHKHTSIFVDKKLEGIHKGSTGDSSDIYLFGRDTKKGDPIFKKRGECSKIGFHIDKKFFDLFNAYYFSEIEGKENELELAQRFVDKHFGTLIREESEREAFERIAEEGRKNKELIEEKLGNRVTSFCWPWGHNSTLGLEALKSVGYKSFVTTKKGTNSLWGNYKKIRRIELRKFTLKKFVMNIKLNRNLILGRLYELVS